MIQNDYFQITPIPIETAYFLKNAASFKTEKGTQLIRDRNKFNRYYFNYPPEWKTANVGEMIVGVRSLWTMNRPREFYFNIFLRKYKKKDFYKAMELYDPEYKNYTDDQKFKAVTSMDDEEIQYIVNEMDDKNILVFPFNMHISLRSKDNFNDMWSIINETLATQTNLKHIMKEYISASNNSIADKIKFTEAIDKYNDNNTLLYQYDRDVWFKQDVRSIHATFGSEKDVELFETYNNNELIETFFSPCNMSSGDPYFVDMLFVHDNKTYSKKYENASNANEVLNDASLPPFFADNLYSGKSRQDPKPLDKSDEFNYDFNAIFNVGEERYQNNLDYVTSYHRNLSFRNVYNRSTLKIHASFANQSNNYYVGNSHVYFDPIKYYKLNSKDDKFWVEFYSGRHSDYPVNLTEDEGFVLEMLFMQNQKLLYT